MNSSKYLKSPQEFYNELAVSIEENDSHKVLSTLLRMGFSGVNIHEIVSGTGIPDAKPLYFEAADKDIEILQHMQEFGVIIPEEIKVPPPELPRPKALDSNKMFAQHFVFRRTKEGREILNSSPACSGFCYEYVLFNMKPHKRTDEDFLDKLLRELYEHSTNFYQRIRQFQDFASSFVNETLVIDKFDHDKEDSRILDLYPDELKNSEFVYFNLQFDKGYGHALVIRKLDTPEGMRYQLFDPTAYDGRWLTADELNERFRQQMKNYDEKWEWGKLNQVYLADIGEYMKKMEYLQKDDKNKHPFKNIHQLKKALDEKDIDGIKTFLASSRMSKNAVTMPHSVSQTIFDYLIGNHDMVFKKKIIDTLSENNLATLTEAILSSGRNIQIESDVLKSISESKNFRFLPEEIIQRIEDINLLKEGLEKQNFDSVKTFLVELKMNEDIIKTPHSMSNTIFNYLISNNIGEHDLIFKNKIINSLSDRNFIIMTNAIMASIENNKSVNLLLELISKSKNCELLPGETIKQIEELNLLMNAMEKQDFNDIKKSLEKVSITTHSIKTPNSASSTVFNYLISDYKTEMKEKIITALSGENFSVMTNAILNIRLPRAKKNKLLELIMNNNDYNKLPKEATNKIESILGVTKQQAEMTQTKKNI